MTPPTFLFKSGPTYRTFIGRLPCRMRGPMQGFLHTGPSLGHLVPRTPPPPCDTHLGSTCDALKQLDPCTSPPLVHHPQSPGSPTRALWPPPEAVLRGRWASGGCEAQRGVGAWGSSGFLNHHLELTWKRRAGFSSRLGSEGRGKKHPCSSEMRRDAPPCPAPAHWVASGWALGWAKGVLLPAHLARVPEPCG